MQSDKQTADSTEINSEEEIVLLVKQDIRNFPLLYDRYVDQIYKYFLSRVQNREIAEDLTSELFFTILKNFNKYKHKGYFRAWMYKIAQNLFYRQLQTPSQPAIEDFEYVPSTESLPEQNAIEKERISKVRQFILEDSDLSQEILRLRFVAELKFSEISILIGKSESATKKHFYRLLERIKEFVENEK